MNEQKVVGMLVEAGFNIGVKVGMKCTIALTAGVVIGAVVMTKICKKDEKTKVDK